MLDHQAKIRAAYTAVKTSCQRDWGSKDANQALHDLVILCLQFLATECHPKTLHSAVPGKKYISYARNDAPAMLSRPANCALFLPDPKCISELWKEWFDEQSSYPETSRMLYTASLAPCLAMELFDRQNKKGPATYFEHFIGHIFAKTLKSNPRKQKNLPIKAIKDRSVPMTMDFLFDLSKEMKIHLSVKMSSRERVVQTWAHQCMLNSAYGNNVYKGIMVIFCETKLDSRSHEVVEICVPDQWLAYQTLLAKMERIYYFDLPARYASLTKQFPETIVIKQFTDFFKEIQTLLAAYP